MMVQPTLTLTVTSDGDRDRVRASIGGIVGVSFYPGAGEKMPPNPLNGHGGQSITVRCDRTVSWRGGRPRVRTIPEAKRRNGDGVEIRVWVGRARRAWAADSRTRAIRGRQPDHWMAVASIGCVRRSRKRKPRVSIWGSIKHAVHHAAHAAKEGAKKAGKVAGAVLGGAVGTVKDGAENKGDGQSDDASKDKGHDA